MSTTLHDESDGSVLVDGVSKTFGNNKVVNEVTLKVNSGEFVSLLGPSGSGKTTTLMMIAGFENPDGGAITIGGRPMASVPPQKRNLGFVFQSYALFPHMTIARNVGYPLELRGVKRPEIERKVAEALRMVDLPIAEYGNRMPPLLSGGQQQRVALARAIVFGPRVMLLDEPLGALDRRLREAMLDEFRDLHRRLGTTMIYVTHDQEEALTMSDRVAVFANGRIQQIGAPGDLYNTPENEFVATFLGDSNRIPVHASDATGVWKSTDGSLLPASAAHNPAQPVLVVRPEFVRVVDPIDGVIHGKVSDVMYVGDHVRVSVSTLVGTLVAKLFGTDARRTPRTGESVGLAWTPDDAVVVRAGVAE
jgi:putative spermidine/putrescine transport system ATP-binding protein